MSNEDEMNDELEAEDGPKIEASSELEDALREATESVEAREKDATAADDAASPDKLTIELLSTELQELKAAHEEKLNEVATNLNVGQMMLLFQYGNMRKETANYITELFAKQVAPQVRDLFDDRWENAWWPKPLDDDERAPVAGVPQ